MTLDKLTADTLDLLAQMRADIAEGKVRVVSSFKGRTLTDYRSKLIVLVEEVKEKAT
jgi:hypothetical protein